MHAGEAGDGNEGDPNGDPNGDPSGDPNGDPKEKNYTEYEVSTTTTTGEFLLLSLDLPPLPLFKNKHGDAVVQQLPLYQLLAKFDGAKPTKEIWNNVEKTYRIVALPRFLLLNICRFTKNEFFFEKDTSIVLFPVRDLEMRDFFFPPVRAASRDIVLRMSVTPLRAFITQNGESCEGEEGLDALRAHALAMVERGGMLLPNMTCTKYDLVANICHDVEVKEEERQTAAEQNPVESGRYRVHLRNSANNMWYEVQELLVKETQPELVSVSESSILVYQQQAGGE